MAKLTLLLGPVGAGKTTLGLKMSAQQSAIFLNLDEWMTNLFRPDRPHENLMEWHLARVARCKTQILKITERSLSSGVDVILEIGIIRKIEREEFLNWVDENQIDLQIYILDVERSVRRERVLQRNNEKGLSYSMEVPMDFFEMASNLWEPVQSDEIENRSCVIL